MNCPRLNEILARRELVIGKASPVLQWVIMRQSQRIKQLSTINEKLASRAFWMRTTLIKILERRYETPGN